MPAKGGESLASQIRSSYQQLSAAASQLNFASDELGKHVAALDAALKKLNLGVSTWVSIRGDHNVHDYYWSEDLGYAKVGNKWGIALRETSGCYGHPDGDEIDQWLFKDAPRRLRIDGVDRLPALLEQLVKEAEQFTERIKQKTLRARELATVITASNRGGDR